MVGHEYFASNLGKQKPNIVAYTKTNQQHSVLKSINVRNNLNKSYTVRKGQKNLLPPKRGDKQPPVIIDTTQ